MMHTDAGRALLELRNQLADFGAAYESAGEHDKATAYVHAVRLAQDAIDRLDKPGDVTRAFMRMHDGLPCEHVSSDA